MSRRYRLVMEEVRNEEKLPASTLALEDSRIVIKGDPEFDSITEQKYTIANDYIKECEISHSDGVELKYARDNSFSVSKDGKNIAEYTLTSDSEWRGCRGNLGEFRGTIIQKRAEKYSESVNRELFYYDNGAVAYEISRTALTPLTTICYPSGQKWIEFTSNCNLNGTGLAIANGEIYGRWWGGNRKSPFIALADEKIVIGKEALNTLDLSRITQLCKVRTFDYTEYGKSKDEILTKGKVVNGQAVEVWRFQGNNYYYLNGVRVSDKLYNAKPEELDPNNIINMDNAQLRAALLAKVGFESVVQQCKGVVVDKDGDMELISIPLKEIKTGWGSGGDTELKILKVKCPSTNVFYTLRVPPDIKKCEEGRQWTFGERADKPEEYMEFALET